MGEIADSFTGRLKKMINFREIYKEIPDRDGTQSVQTTRLRLKLIHNSPRILPILTARPKFPDSCEKLIRPGLFIRNVANLPENCNILQKLVKDREIHASKSIKKEQNLSKFPNKGKISILNKSSMILREKIRENERKKNKILKVKSKDKILDFKDMLLGIETLSGWES